MQSTLKDIDKTHFKKDHKKNLIGMEYMFIIREGDKEAIFELKNNFKKSPKSDIIAAYNNCVKIGIVGAHAQAQRILALHFIFISIFEKSPINIEHDLIISLTGMIGLKNEQWYYLNN
jgi:hypothetical protein